ncbi:hypothetical protein L2E82_03585 [Cichorium intybus]|uniref:Uncharacterized protein n=1 Tax=Cichorium intybus TaxID=13427 RepID=A0ACB9H430_CICIN|nr:hypothetical protein L2E82_03585 [Cichorium intybus]
MPQAAMVVTLGRLGFVKEINWIQILNLNDGQRCEGGVKACDTIVSGEGVSSQMVSGKVSSKSDTRCKDSFRDD